MALLSGKTGYVNVAGQPYRFGKWDLTATSGVPKAFNFVDAPYEVYVSGLLGCKLTCDGPYDANGMPLTVGNSYAFVLGFTNAIFLSVTGILNSLNPSNDVENNPIIKIGVQVSGPFSTSII